MDGLLHNSSIYSQVFANNSSSAYNSQTNAQDLVREKYFLIKKKKVSLLFNLIKRFKYYSDSTNMMFAILIQNADLSNFGFNTNGNEYRIVSFYF